MSRSYVADKVAKSGPKYALQNAARAELERLRQSSPKFRTSNLLEFIPSASPELRAPLHLKPFLDLLERSCSPGNIRYVVAAPPQHGKAARKSLILLTKSGLKTAGEVTMSDYLVGSDGKWTKVIGVFPQGKLPIFRVGFNDGTHLDTCGEHLWSVKQRYGGPWWTKSTSELALDLTEGSEGRLKWRIPLVKPIEGTKRDLPIDPYWLGLWLGDGCKGNTSVCSMDDCVSDYIHEYADRLGQRVSRSQAPNNKASSWSIVSKKGSVNTLAKLLKANNLYRNKHIPADYLTADIETRLAVLQGLCDTDGTVAKNGSQQSYCTTDLQLLEGFRFLVSSLGGTYTIVEKPTYRKLAYNIYFRLPDGMPGFRMKRKQERLNAFSAKVEPTRLVKSITPVGDDEAVCFMVAAEDHLYCAGPDFIVTHNSVCVIHALLWLAFRHPGKKHAYITFSEKRAEYVSRQLQVLAAQVGLEPEGNLSDVRLKGGTEIKFTSIGGTLTGFTVNGLMIIDDPVKDRVDAESPTVRQNTSDWFTSVALTRIHPGTSIICMATRWHPEDLSGTLLSLPGYQYLNFKAISEGPVDEETGIVIGDPIGRLPGQALFPELKPVDFFDEHRIDSYNWESMYQGEPRGRGQSVFRWPDRSNPSHWYNPEMNWKYDRISIGLDFAYSAKTHADYSVAVVMGETNDIYHVIDVVRVQVEPRDFRNRIELLRARYEGCTATAYVAATEKGGIEFIRETGIPINCLVAKQDKFMRAVPMASAWSQGKILLPAKSDWLVPYLNEVCNFTGVKDKHDDQVDSSAAAFDGFGPKPVKFRPEIVFNDSFEQMGIGLG